MIQLRRFGFVTHAAGAHTATAAGTVAESTVARNTCDANFGGWGWGARDVMT